jgi:hypothetical protein
VPGIVPAGAPRPADALTQINETGGMEAYPRRKQAAPGKGVIMSATVVEFPYRQANAQHCVPPPDAGSCQVLQFPHPSHCLSKHDLEAVVALTSSAGSGWHCDTEWDGNGDLAAVLVSGTTEDHDLAGFLICRSDRKLLLMDAQRSTDWRILGVFDDSDDLALALGRIIG